MEFGTPFSYPFKDPNWFKKFILPGLCMLIPVIGQFVLMGWMVEIVRRVINDIPDLLPELDFGSQLGKGFQTWVIDWFIRFQSLFWFYRFNWLLQ